MGATQKIIGPVEALSLPKLSKNFEECEDHFEFELWKRNLSDNFHLLLEILGRAELEDEGSSNIIARLVIFFYELKCAGKWVANSNSYCRKLNETFVLLYQVPIDELFIRENKFEGQKLFDECISELHRQLTLTDFKKYPLLVDVYCSIVENIKNYKFERNPVTVLPISLLLIDDYVPSNKIKGLRCCTSILKCVPTTYFDSGNYYEVVYQCLKKVIIERDIEVTKLLNTAIVELLKALPSNVQVNKALEVYSDILEQLNIESNLYRKVELFDIAKNVIQILGVNCMKKKEFVNISCDNIDLCCTEGIGDILLWKCLECIEEWIKQSWCIWKINKDYKLLSKLFKYLLVCKENPAEEKVIGLIVTLVEICSVEEKALIITSLENINAFENEKLETIKTCLRV